jgi:hypothetical protein
MSRPSKPQRKTKRNARTQSWRPRPRNVKKPFITRAEARWRAERHVLDRMFKGARVRDGAKVRLGIYRAGRWIGYTVGEPAGCAGVPSPWGEGRVRGNRRSFVDHSILDVPHIIQVFQGGRLAIESIRFASSSFGKISALGSHLSARCNCLATPPSNIALAARWATSTLQMVFFRVRTHSRKLPEWLSLR